MSVVKWSIPPELMDCIAGYEYSFQYSGVSGLLPANTTMLLLDMFNISTPCNVDYPFISCATTAYQKKQQLIKPQRINMITIGRTTSGSSYEALKTVAVI